MHIKSGELLTRLIVVSTALLILGGSIGCGDDSEVILKPIERTNSQQRADELVPTHGRSSWSRTVVWKRR